VRRHGEDLGRGRREVVSGRVSAVVFTSVSASSSLLDPERPATEFGGDVGYQFMCSLPDPSDTWSGGSEGGSD
jgi:hypothetical protein